MENIYSKLSSLDDLDKNLSSLISSMNLEKKEKHFNAKILHLQKRVENVKERLKNTNKSVDEAKMLLKRIDAAQSQYDSLIENYDSIKTLSTAFLNMKRTIKYAEMISEQKIKKIDLTNIRKMDKLKYKLTYYAKDLSKQEYIEVKPIIDTIEKEFLDWECEMMEFAKKIFDSEMDQEKVQNRLEMLNIIQEIDEDSRLARKGRDGTVKDTKKEYFTHSFTERQSIKFLVTEEMICSNSNQKNVLLANNPESNNFARLFYRDNKYLATRPLSEIKLRFIKNILAIFIKRPTDFILSDIKILLEYEKYFNREISNSIFQFIHEVLTIRLKKPYESASEILATINLFTAYEELTRASSLSFKHPLVDITELKLRYTEIMKGKLSIWIENITAAELKSIKSRNVRMDEEEHFISTNFINLLKIVKEVLEPVTFDRSLYNSLLIEVIANVNNFKSMICDTIQSEYSKNTVNLVSGFEEYCICISNSGLKLTQYVTSISEYEDDEAANQSGLIELSEVFISLTRFSNSILSKFVIFTLKPALKKLFTDSYYKDEMSVMSMFKATIGDFLTDYQQSMDDYVFITFLSDLVKQISLTFLEYMTKKRSKIYQILPEYLEKNEKSLNRTISKYCADENIRFDLTGISPLITVSSTEQFITELRKIKYEYEIKSDLVKGLIKRRTDLSDMDKREMLEAINTVYCDAEKKTKKGFFSGYL